MRIPRRNIPEQPLNHMWERHKEIARRLLCGERQADIAKALNMSLSRISIICNSPIFKHHLDRLSHGRNEEAIDIQRNLQHNAELASQILNQILSNKVEAPTHLKARVAMDALDRGGFPKVSISKNENVNVTLTADKLEEIKRKREVMLKGLQSSVKVIEP